MAYNLQQCMTEDADVFHHHYEDALEMLQTLQARPAVLLFLLSDMDEKALATALRSKHDKANHRHANTGHNLLFLSKIRELSHAPETRGTMQELTHLLHAKIECAQAVAPTPEEEAWHRTHDYLRGTVYDLRHDGIVSRHTKKEEAELSYHVEKHDGHKQTEPAERPEIAPLQAKMKEIDASIRKLTKGLTPELGGRLHQLKNRDVSPQKGMFL